MKPKKLLLPFLLTIISFSAYSQVWNWANKLQAPDQSGIHGIATVIDVQGNHVVLSGVDTTLQIEGNFSLNNQFFVTKYDNQGTLIWTKNFSHSTSLWSYELTTDSAGNIYLLTDKFTKIDGVSYTGPNAPHYLTKLNVSGDLVWTKAFGKLNTYYNKVLKTDGKNLYVFANPAYSNSFQFLDTTFTAPTPPGGIHPEFTFLAKIDTAGNRKWQRLFIDTLGYSWSIAMNLNNKKEIAISGVFRKKIWINNTSFTNTGVWDYQYIAVFNTDNGQVLNTIPVGSSLNYLFWAIGITDSSVLVYPQHFQDTVNVIWTLPSGSFTSTYLPGSYLVAKKNGNSQTIKQVSYGLLVNVSGLETDTTNNVFVSIKNTFVTGQTTYDSAYFAVIKYNVSFDTARTALWQAIVGGNYRLAPINSAIGSSIAVRNGEISFTGGLHNTATFGPYTVTANNLRKGFIASLKDVSSSITGKVFVDANNNGLFDAGEMHLSNRAVTTQNNYIDYTDWNGDYKLSIDTGNHIVQPSPITYYNVTPASHNLSFTNYGQIVTNKNFAFQVATTANDLETDVTPITPARPGRPLYYMITLKNKGTTTLTNKYALKMGTGLSYVSSDSIATIVGDSIVWNYSNFSPFQTRSNIVQCTVGTGVNAGTIIKSIGFVYPIAGDNTAVNNIDTAYSTVTASYDPNDKLVFPGNQVHIDSVQQNKQFLEYIIRFQNTGTDTAFQVKVIDSLAAKLNIQSFELISSSHPVLINRKGQRTFEFYFPNILLPDSNVNEVRSHGFVKFRIKPITTVVLTDSVHNYADIYFDYNSPVKTNTVATGFRNTLITGINSPTVNAVDLKIYPNPVVSEQLNYRLSKSPRETLILRIYDMKGRLIFSRNVQGNGDTLIGEVQVGTFSSGHYIMEIRSKMKMFVREFSIR